MVNWNMVLLMVVYFICAAVTCWVVCTGPLPPDAIYMHTETTGNRECLSYGYMSTGVAYGGLFYFRSGTGLGNMSWYIATI